MDETGCATDRAVPSGYIAPTVGALAAKAGARKEGGGPSIVPGPAVAEPADDPMLPVKEPGRLGPGGTKHRVVDGAVEDLGGKKGAEGGASPKVCAEPDGRLDGVRREKLAMPSGWTPDPIAVVTAGPHNSMEKAGFRSIAGGFEAGDRES